jgi:hypothetical protein
VRHRTAEGQLRQRLGCLQRKYLHEHLLTRQKAPQSTECDQILSVVARASPMLHRNVKSWRMELGIYATRFGRST